MRLLHTVRKLQRNPILNVQNLQKIRRVWQIDGLTAVNPVTGKEIPIWISDYVLMSYGTGAIMAVPAHDERDWEFAKKFNLPMIQVVAKNGEEVDINEAAFTDVATGVLINSEFLNGLEVKDAKGKNDRIS